MTAPVAVLTPDLAPGTVPPDLDPTLVAGAVDALRLLASIVPLNSRDFAADPLDALLYALVAGWGCEQCPDGPDCDDPEMCGADGAFLEVAARYRWDEAAQDRIRSMRAAIRALTQGGDR